jgi:hypothetical protein
VLFLIIGLLLGGERHAQPPDAGLSLEQEVLRALVKSCEGQDAGVTVRTRACVITCDGDDYGDARGFDGGTCAYRPKLQAIVPIMKLNDAERLIEPRKRPWERELP